LGGFVKPKYIMRTANRNIDFLHRAMEQINNDVETIQSAIKRVGTPKEIDAFFDKKSIAFGRWLLGRNERTLEHSMEDLMQAYNDYIHSAPNEEQVDYYRSYEQRCSNETTHAPGGCPL